MPENQFGGWAKLLVILVMLVLAAQFVPYARNWPPENSETVTTFFSPAPGRSLEASLFVLSLLGFALFVAQLPRGQRESLTNFLFIGLIAIVAIGAMQLSFARDATIEGVLPYPMTSAIFANENHLSTLVFALIPLIAWRMLSVARRPFSYLLVVAFLLVFLFAVGSRAGMSISLGISLFALFWFFAKDTSPYLKLIILALALAGLGYVAYSLQGFSSLEGDLRTGFFRNTWTAIQDFWLFGSGLGTFQMVYPLYEPSEEIIHLYANQAHNDYLQILLETGIFGIALVGMFYGLALLAFSHSKLSQAAMISILAIALHSIVDYPLRTMAVGIVFAYLAALVFSREEPEPDA